MSAGQVLAHLARDVRVAKHRGQIMSAREGAALKLADDNLSVVRVANDAWCDAVEADKAQSAEDLFVGKSVASASSFPRPFAG